DLPPMHVLVDEELAPLRAHDPGFDAAKFSARTIAVMSLVNQAWCAGDMGPARALVSDGVFVRFQTYLALLASRGLRDVMGSWTPLSAELVALDSDDRWDTLHVQIKAEARDADVPIASTPEQVESALADAPFEPYTEIWSFVRRRGVTTPADVVGGAIE